MHNHHPHPKFSIITVTYNAAKVLEDTIQSIVTQTYKNLEIILVDDGSTDKSGSICDSYKKKDPRIVVIRNISRNTTVIVPAHNIPAFKPSKAFAGRMKSDK